MCLGKGYPGPQGFNLGPWPKMGAISAAATAPYPAETRPSDTRHQQPGHGDRQRYRRLRDPSVRPRRWALSPLADAGESQAQIPTAIMAQNGLGMTENADLAFRYMKAAAEAGIDLAQHGLGFMYMGGVCP